MIKRNSFLFLGFIGLLFFFFACAGKKKEINDYSEYVKYLNNPENGLIKTKIVSGIKITVKYLPEEFLALKDIKDEKNISSLGKDSIVNIYKRSKTFLLTVGPASEEGDIMYEGIKDYQEYKLRSLIMNFEMNDYINLETDKNNYTPVLTNLENLYSLGTDRTISVVFVPVKDKNELTTASSMDFIFNDEIFETGINHFVFSKEDIDKTPTFIFNKYLCQNLK